MLQLWIGCMMLSNRRQTITKQHQQTARSVLEIDATRFIRTFVSFAAFFSLRCCFLLLYHLFIYFYWLLFAMLRFHLIQFAKGSATVAAAAQHQPKIQINEENEPLTGSQSTVNFLLQLIQIRFALTFFLSLLIVFVFVVVIMRFSIYCNFVHCIVLCIWNCKNCSMRLHFSLVFCSPECQPNCLYTHNLNAIQSNFQRYTKRTNWNRNHDSCRRHNETIVYRQILHAQCFSSCLNSIIIRTKED